MAARARTAVFRYRNYLAIVLCLAAVNVAARYWDPYTSIQITEYQGEFGWEKIHTDAWPEHAYGSQGYWVSKGGTANCWIEVTDEDHWADGAEQGTAFDTIDWKNVIWNQVHGSWVADNNNNNNSNGNGAGRGAFVTWRPDAEAYNGWARVIELNDKAILPPGDMGTRKDGPQVENSIVHFKVFRIDGPEPWYFGEIGPAGWPPPEGPAWQPYVDRQYGLIGTYTVTLANDDALYEWEATGSLLIKDPTDSEAEWTPFISKVGLTSVMAKPVVPGSGSLIVSYLWGALSTTKDVVVHYPSDLEPYSGEEEYFRQYIETHAGGIDKTGYHPGRRRDHYYDMPIWDLGDQPPPPPLNHGYASHGLFTLYDERGWPVPYFVGAQEHFVACNFYNGKSRGYTLLEGEDWLAPWPQNTYHGRATDAVARQGGMSEIDLKLWAWVPSELCNWPTPLEPTYQPVDLICAVQWVGVDLSFGTWKPWEYEPAYNRGFTYEHYLRVGRHN